MKKIIKNEEEEKKKKKSRGMSILAIPSLTRSLKLKPFGLNRQLWDTQTDRQTDIATGKLNRPRLNRHDLFD